MVWAAFFMLLIKTTLYIYGADCDDKAVSICSQYIPNAKLITIDSIGSPANLLLEN